MNGPRHVKRITGPAAILRRALPVLFWMAGAGASEATATYGLNFDFLDIGPNSCLHERGAPNASVAVLRNYEQHRSEVKNILKIAHDSGFTSLRFLVWFTSAKTHGENVYSTADYEQAAADVSAYLQDIQAAGFSRAILSFGPVGPSSPSCRRSEWGDCFDAGSIADSASFVTGLRAALKTAGRDRLWVDLLNEGGINSYHSPLVHKNFTQYLDAVVGAYVGKFAEDKTTISVQQRGSVQRIEYVQRIYADVGHRPDFLDVHIYQPADPQLQQLGLFLQHSYPSTPVMVGEFPFGRFAAAADMLTTLRRSPSEATEIDLWPLGDVDHSCGIDIRPPYRLNELRGGPK